MVEVLVATLNTKNVKNLVEKMNIKGPAVISNQGDYIADNTYNYDFGTVRFLSMISKGVGHNRNNALYNSKSEICLVADDDMRYVDNYINLVESAFKDNPTADIIIFNLKEKNSKRYKIRKKMKINIFNYTKFGAARIAFRREEILKKRISFSLLFGGGAKYSAGEDTLFLRDCLSSKLEIIAVPIEIAELEEESVSTWFTGYNKKLLKDTGACYSELFSWTLYLRIVYFSVKNRKKLKENNFGFYESIKLIMLGVKEFKTKGKKNEKNSDCNIKL